MKVIWSDFAIENLKDIFEYYSINANKKVDHVIRKQILDATHQLKMNPESGQKEFCLESLEQDYRYLVVTNYKIIYRVDNNQIFINDVFDTRQDPIKIIDEKRKLK